MNHQNVRLSEIHQSRGANAVRLLTGGAWSVKFHRGRECMVRPGAGNDEGEAMFIGGRVRDHGMFWRWVVGKTT